MSDSGGRGTISAGVLHLRAEWGRWWRAEDLTDTHIAHRVLNDQYRVWRQWRQRNAAEVQQNIGLLKDQQKRQTYMQMQQMALQKQARGRGYGYGGGYGASPVISYRMMQWAQLQMRMGQQEFKHLEVTPSMLQIGYGQVRSRRHLTAGVLLLVLPLMWAGLWLLSVPAALTVTAVAVLVFTAAAWVKGRTPTWRRPPVPKLLFVPPAPPAHTELEDPDPQPFPIREAGTNPRQAREAVRLALKKENARVSEVLVPEETAYGWKVPLVLQSGTAGQLVSVLRPLATTLRVGESRVLAQPADPDDAALVSLQILTRDPFATPLPYPERPPGSCSIVDSVSLGLSLEGATTPVVLAGQHVIIVADTGGGKTAMVQAIAEYATACRDAVVVDIDPVKRGLKALAPAAVITARTPQEAETVLEGLLARARDRIASMPPTQDTWIPSPTGPAVLAFLDEYPQLSKRGKELAVALLRIGREARITIVLCTQDATSDVLGDAIADAFGVRIMLPCRAADVPLVVGRADAISRGWLPHLLVPSPEPGFPADAGRFYCLTPRHRTPVLRYVSPLPPAEADRRTRERLAAGLPRLESAQVPAPQAAVPEIARLLLAAFATHGDPPALTLAQLADHLTAADPATWGKWDGQKNRLLMVGRTVKARLKTAGLDIPTERLSADTDPKRPTAYRLADIKGALS
ncbi:ATP-binding protein [Streptomyces sp. NPDC093109]|uniref:ATP-binding protein n=1 Tax=Streptomyces sp. NPDC093109 TaxID=3154977 RepID=UPI00344B158D